MNRQQWVAWLSGWLRQHPAKEPPAEQLRGYSAQVMRRIHAAEAPAPIFNVVVRPRLAWGLATVAACAVVLAVAMPRNGNRLARSVEHDWVILQQLDEPVEVELEADEVEAEWQMLDQLMFAEAAPAAGTNDEAEIEHLLRVLEQVDEEGTTEALDDDYVSDEELLEELELYRERHGSTASS